MPVLLLLLRPDTGTVPLELALAAVGLEGADLAGATAPACADEGRATVGPFITWADDPDLGLALASTSSFLSGENDFAAGEPAVTLNSTRVAWACSARELRSSALARLGVRWTAPPDSTLLPGDSCWNAVRRPATSCSLRAADQYQTQLLDCTNQQVV